MQELIYYGGEGYDYAPEKGEFAVKTDSEEKKFERLSDAIEYYDSLNEEKCLWDLTKLPELLSAHTLKN
jgi:hypothetical protein